LGVIDLGYEEEAQRDPTQTSLHQIIKSTYKKVLFEKEQEPISARLSLAQRKAS